MVRLCLWLRVAILRVRIICTVCNNGNWATHVLQTPVHCLTALVKEGSVVLLTVTYSQEPGYRRRSSCFPQQIDNSIWASWGDSLYDM